MEPNDASGSPPSAWTRYWAQGALHAFGGFDARNYSGAVASFWATVFRGCSTADRVLDIGTGNGALPRAMLDARPDGDVACDAIDVADIAPTWVTALPTSQARRLRFHSRTAIEHLPFADASFDLAVSQFGFEYGNVATGAAQLKRVLKPGGRIAMVVHHAASRSVTLAHDEITHLDWLAAPQGLLDTCGRLLEPMSRARTAAGRQQLTHDPAANALRDRYNGLQAELRRRGQVAVCPDVLAETHQLCADVVATAVRDGLDPAARRWLAWRGELADSRQRLSALCASARDAAAMSRWHDLLPPGSEVLLGELRDDDLLIGWTWQVRLPA